MTNLTNPSGFSPRDLKTWNRYYVPQSDALAYRVGDVVKSAGGTDAAGIITVTRHTGSGPVRGVIVSVDPGLPATGGLQPNGQLASVPAVKTHDYYVWVADDPTQKFTAVDDGLTAANLVPNNVGSFVNFTPGTAPAANGSSTSALTSSTFGGAAGAGCVKVLQIQPGSTYGPFATWLLQFAQHELAPGSSATVAGGAIARSAAQLAGVPSGGDVALGATAQFYDPLQTVDATHPWVYYSATPTAYVKIASSGTGGNGNGVGVGTWNLTTNVATAPDGVTTFTPANGVYPASGANFLLCTGTGTRVLDGNTFSPNDYAVMNAALGQWVRSNASSGSIANSTKPLKGDGNGNAVAAIPGTDIGAPIAVAIGTPIILMQAGTIGANGALTITGTAFSSGFTDGHWGYYPANAITGSNPAGFYWTVMSTTTAGTVYNNTYTPGSSSPNPPSSPTPFSGTAGAAYTNATGAYVVVAQVALGTNPMGPNGFLKLRHIVFSNTAVTAHNIQMNLNGTLAGVQASASGTSVQFAQTITIQNAGRTDRQIAANPQVGDIYVGSSGVQRSSVDTSAATTWALKLTLGATSDWVALLGLDLSCSFAA